ncbi:MAG: hypothetical protein HeimC3_28960 [Candidatus Heimdallarchaeota archaeon LC_3]|nr:MAG: hypothetical protein HeimC3_28960 [Candidatus Heimdallarchaeota archaeon LC_3]
MTQKVCPNCGKEISESQFCLHCGMPLTDLARKSPTQRAIKNETKEMSNLWIFLIMCLCLTPIGGIIFLFLIPTFFF